MYVDETGLVEVQKLVPATACEGLRLHPARDFLRIAHDLENNPERHSTEKNNQSRNRKQLY